MRDETWKTWEIRVIREDPAQHGSVAGAPKTWEKVSK